MYVQVSIVDKCSSNFVPLPMEIVGKHQSNGIWFGYSLFYHACIVWLKRGRIVLEDPFGTSFLAEWNGPIKMDDCSMFTVYDVYSYRL